MKDFDFSDVAGNFNTHLTGQLPWYNQFIDGMFIEFARYFCRTGSVVYDFGASTGNIETAIGDIISDRDIDFIPVEQNISMIQNYMGDKSRVIQEDILSVELKPFSFASSILCLSFVHPSKRYEFLLNAMRVCEVGGAFVILEKFMNKEGALGTVFNRITWREKIQTNQSLEQIIGKEMSLSGVQYPLYLSEVEDMVPIWQFGDFRSFIYIKTKQESWMK
jgi:ubiquinone/menaquinone biosynthesis C-methylase UbiE